VNIFPNGFVRNKQIKSLFPTLYLICSVCREIYKVTIECSIWGHIIITNSFQQTWFRSDPILPINLLFHIKLCWRHSHHNNLQWMQIRRTHLVTETRCSSFPMSAHYLVEFQFLEESSVLILIKRLAYEKNTGSERN
jgi:hypothetical protein